MIHIPIQRENDTSSDDQETVANAAHKSGGQGEEATPGSTPWTIPGASGSTAKASTSNAAASQVPEEAEGAEATPDHHSAPQDSLFSFEGLRFFFLCMLAILVFRSSFFAFYDVPTASMEPTIKVGDRIIANKLAYGFRLPFVGKKILSWGEVERGDIVVFRYPLDPKTDFVKRVVAIESVPQLSLGPFQSCDFHKKITYKTNFL